MPWSQQVLNTQLKSSEHHQMSVDPKRKLYISAVGRDIKIKEIFVKPPNSFIFFVFSVSTDFCASAP